MTPARPAAIRAVSPKKAAAQYGRQLDLTDEQTEGTKFWFAYVEHQGLLTALSRRFSKLSAAFSDLGAQT